ncbi:MAG: hypothetical protein A2V70_05300 [Planctomycetes bacterium RBG_13_63_9]|nr:MAG: hypothetical protein A2V70_05300 [Planctomycetes bacterium RBG_13_63_9]
MDQALDGLRQQGVAVVIGSGERYVAVVGSQTVRVGDLLDGFRVIAIAPDGVTVERPVGREE